MKCNAAFFGMKNMPQITIKKDELEELARRSSGMGIAVTGVQKKLSLLLSDEGSGRLTLIGYPTGYILKPQTEDFKCLPEAEDLVMDIAEMMGVRTAEHGLIEIDGDLAYITKREDRLSGEVYAMEDFCQLSERQPQDKYKGSYERCATLIKNHSVLTGFDLSEFYLRLVVCFATGNSDMHLKNFSLIERTPGGRDFVLSKAYDLLPVNLVLPEDKDETALTLNGKKSKLKRKDFLEFAKSIELNEKSAEHIIDSVIEKKDDAIKMCKVSFMPDEMKQDMEDLMKERINRLNIQ